MASQMFISILKSKLDFVQLAFDIEEAYNFNLVNLTTCRLGRLM